MKVNFKTSVRERIMTVADDLFHKQGYNATGINQIIAEANIAKSSLYYHFPSKEALCVAFLNERHKYWLASFKLYLGDQKGKIIRAFDFIAKDNLAYNFRGCSFLNILSETEPESTKVLDEIKRHKLVLQRFFATEITINNTELAYTVYSLFENAIIESQMFRSNEPVDRLKNIAASLIAEKA